MKWTLSQEKAITTRNTNILVSAAAGSGKTAVLTQRIIRLISDDKEDISTMLILTFTKSAANEMKTRIRQKLIEHMSKNHNDLHIKRQIDLIGQANISTMHSFCIELIRENFEVLDIDPNFTMGNNSIISILKDEAIQEVFEEKYDNTEINDDEKEKISFINLVDIYSKKNDDKNLIDIVYQIYNFIQSKENPIKWLFEQADEYNIDDIKDSKYILKLTDIIRLKMKNIKNIIEKSITICDEYAISSYKETLLKDLNDIENLQNSLEKGYDLFAEYISEFKESKMNRKKKDEDEIGIQKIKRIRDNQIKKQGFNELKKYNVKSMTYINYMKKYYPVIISLCELVEEFDKRYSQKKLEKNILDFNDLEHFALKLLKNDDCRQRIKNKYRYIFYDEYQDSNDVQENIIQSIASDNNLFFVGDVKQSIYRFRLAKPEIFINKSENYKNENGGILINLSENFRSDKNIIDFCNKIFEKIMKEDIAEVEYDESARLKSDKEESDNYKRENIQINILSDIEKEESEKNDDIDDIEDEELIAVLTAKQIQKMVSCIDEKTNEREINYKDIIILKRSLKGSSQIYTKVFRKYKIPLFIDYSTAVFEVLEVSIFIDFLKIIDNIRQDEALLAVLLSSIGKFTIEEITKIKISNIDEKYFYKIFFEYAQNNDDYLAKKINKFIRKIDGYVKVERYMPLDEYVEYVMKDSNYKEYVKSMPQGDMRIQNLEIINEKAREFMQNENKSLFYFLIYINSILKNKAEDTNPSSISDEHNMVRLMSIHKSKGLESKVVIINDLQKKFNMKDSGREILLDGNYGIGADYIDIDNDFYMPTLARKVVFYEYERGMLAEEIRILYVALTRAKNKLILNSFAKKEYNTLIEDIKSGFFPKELGQIRNYRDFVLYAISDDIKNDFENVNLYEFNEIDKNTFFKEEIEKNDMENGKDAYKIFKDKIDKTSLTNEDIDNINSNYNYEYEYSLDVEKAAKVSVTYLTKEKLNKNKYIIEKLSNYETTFNKNLFSPEKIGTLNHLFLQHIDFKFDLTMSDLERKLQKLIEKEFITLQEAEVIDLRKIYNFISSDIGQRIRKSDKIYQEESFIDTYDDMILSGIIDLFFEEDGYIVLLDYKTDTVSRENLKEYADLRYKKQIELYKKSISRAFEKEVKESYIYFLSVGDFIKY